MLDFLQNPPLNKELMNALGGSRVNAPSITPNSSQRSKQYNAKLSGLFGGVISRPFYFSLESFAFLISTFKIKYKVGIVTSSNKMLYEAHQISKDCVGITPDIDSGSIENGIKKAIENGVTCFFISYLNEDILTSNLYLDDLLEPYFTIWDVSYALALDLPLPRNANLMLLSGENFGLLRPYGILCSKSADFFGFSSLNLYLDIENIYEVFLEAISRVKISSEFDLADLFYGYMKDILNDDVYRFYKTPRNTLALGLVGSRARTLIQSLIFDDITFINGVDCLYGFSSPSFVLQLMGFSESRSRELLSLSFNNPLCADVDLLKDSAGKIASKYKQLKKLQG